MDGEWEEGVVSHEAIEVVVAPRCGTYVIEIVCRTLDGC